MKFYKRLIQMVDDAGVVIGKEKARVVENDFGVLYWPKSANLNKIDSVLKSPVAFCNAISFSGPISDAQEKVEAIRAVASWLTDEKLGCILDALSKSDGVAEKQLTPLYMNGLALAKKGGAVFSIELTLVSSELDVPYKPNMWFKVDGEKKKSFVIGFTIGYRKLNKLDMPILGTDGEIVSKTFEKVKYLQHKDLVPGHVYTHANGEDYLLIGAVRYASGFKEMLANPFPADKIWREPKDGTLDLALSEHCQAYHLYLRLTDERRKELAKWENFGGWLTDSVCKYVKGKLKGDYGRLREYCLTDFNDRSSFRFVKDVGEMYDLDHLKCSLDITVDAGITPKMIAEKGAFIDYAKERILFEVLGCRAVLRYDVVLIPSYTMGRPMGDYDLLGSFDDKKSAEKFADDYVKTHPEVNALKLDALKGDHTKSSLDLIAKSVLD